MKQLLLIGTGGFFGSMLRYGVHSWASRWFETWPIGTLGVNILGSFLLGLIVGISVKSDQPIYWLLAIGFCGGFTTFSAFALDGIRLMREDLWAMFFLYSGVSMIGGFLAVAIGMWLGNKFT